MNLLLKFWLIAVLFSSLTISPARAQEKPVAYIEQVPIQADQVQEGHIVSFDGSTYNLSNSPYDSQMYGIVSFNPARAVRLSNNPQAKPVVTEGTVSVLVSTSNGSIMVGDKITSSAIAGVGMKATEAGYILGYAQENLINSDTPQLVTVLIHIHEAKKEKVKLVLDTEQIPFIGGSVNAFDEGNTALLIRYLSASSVVIFSMLLSLFSFGRLAYKGIDSLGRNPLAKRSIILGICINISLALVIVLCGTAAGYLLATR